MVASNSGADSSVYNDLQRKSSELAAAATGIAQFLDRDTIPDHAGAAGDAFAEFIENPGNIDSLLSDLEDNLLIFWVCGTPETSSLRIKIL